MSSKLSHLCIAHLDGELYIRKKMRRDHIAMSEDHMAMPSESWAFGFGVGNSDWKAV